MTSDWLGGGLIVGLAAVLWLIYLLPTWFRRNEYNATERNAVRLQQTLRILAETAEVPDEVRAEANAKSVAEHQRLLKQATVKSVPPAVRAAAKIRRARAVTTGILVLALLVVGLGAVQTAVNGAWIVLLAGVLAAVLCVTRLGRLAKLGRALKLPARNPATIDSFVIVGAGVGGTLTASATVSTDGEAYGDLDDSLAFEEDAERARDIAPDTDGAAIAGDGWTPVPLPKPLYTERRRLRELSVGQVSPALVLDADNASLGFAEQTAFRAEQALRAAARASEQALRDEFAAQDARTISSHVGPEGPASADRPAGGGAPLEADPVRATPAPAIPSRFSTMGIVDETTTASLDVDEVLARRRAG